MPPAFQTQQGPCSIYDGKITVTRVYCTRHLVAGDITAQWCLPCRFKFLGEIPISSCEVTILNEVLGNFSCADVYLVDNFSDDSSQRTPSFMVGM